MSESIAFDPSGDDVRFYFKLGGDPEPMRSSNEVEQAKEGKRYEAKGAGGRKPKTTPTKRATAAKPEVESQATDRRQAWDLETEGGGDGGRAGECGTGGSVQRECREVETEHETGLDGRIEAFLRKQSEGMAFTKT